MDFSVFTQHIYKRWYDEEYDGNGSGLDFQKPNEIFIDNQEFRNLFFAILSENIKTILIPQNESPADGKAFEYSRKC